MLVYFYGSSMKLKVKRKYLTIQIVTMHAIPIMHIALAKPRL